MRAETKAPVASRGGQRWNTGDTSNYSPKEVILQVFKRRKLCTIAKLVRAYPLGGLVLAMPYRHRRQVKTVSLPPQALTLARRAGARLWIVRLDTEGICLSFPLAEVEEKGWLRASEGRPEWFVPLDKFEAISWQEWAFVEQAILLDGGQGIPSQPQARQLTLLEVAT